MKHTLWQEISIGSTRAFHAVIPKPHSRIPLTFSNAPVLLSCFVPFVFLAYLARRPGTYLIRLLFLPTVIIATLTAGFRFRWTIPELNVYNWAIALLAEVVLAKSLEYTFTKEGMLKIGEREPGLSKGKEPIKGSPPISNGSVPSTNGHAEPTEFSETQAVVHFIPSWLYDAFELIHTMRGLRWKFAQGTYIPAPNRPLERRAFLRATLISFIQNFLLLDFFESLLKLFPGVGLPTGGTMFYPTLHPILRYPVSTTIHMFTGTALLAGFGMVYDLFTLIAVGLLDSLPSSWPPVTDHPWSATSMHMLWAQSWHQLLRNTFLVFGGYPGRWLAGDLGMLLGTFVASGLFHECSIYTLGRGLDHTVTVFFASQGLLLIGERVWRQVTGKRVGGTIGRLWVYFVMFICAQPMTNAWHVRGLGGAMVIPPLISPTRIIVDLVRRSLGRSV
ncbi:hypothetical protein R3P38DRAFT_2690550 [Favolaschia claudopus]|uniref:Wax synthase domain-containing protein n=1 Tax=Favolaschia claudopus TaxID=2862362 RepID=A0AAW0D3D3_9AGAR